MSWEERMAQRAAERRDMPFSDAKRATWPVPPEVQQASARDAFLWYIADGWRIFGDSEPIENILDHDNGYHVLRKGSWQLTLVNLDEFPEHKREEQPTDDEAGPLSR